MTEGQPTMNAPVLVMSTSALLGLLLGLVLLRRCRPYTVGRVATLFALVEWLCCSIGVVALGVVWHPNYHFNVRPLLFVIGGSAMLIWVLVGWPELRGLLRGSERDRVS
jgi:peptidoglycan/LPS O-acetylase OafA/YrhL